MKTLRSRLAFGLATISLLTAMLLLMQARNPYARLEHMGKSALRLSMGGPVVRILDRVVGILHCRDPKAYFSQEAEKEEKALLKSGLLVQTRVAIPETWSSREALTALWNRYQETGAYWAASVDRTNNIVVIISKPEDVASFVSALVKE